MLLGGDRSPGGVRYRAPNTMLITVKVCTNGPMTLIFIVCVGLIEKLIRLAPGNHYPGEHPRVCAPEYQVSVWWSLHGGAWWSR